MKLFNHLKPNPLLVNTLVGLGTTIEGAIKFVGGLRVEGVVNGDVTGSENASTVVLVENATINGAVIAIHVIIDGAVIGPITCDTLELKKNAHVVGAVMYKSLIIHQGALVAGTMTPHSIEENGNTPA